MYNPSLSDFKESIVVVYKAPDISKGLIRLKQPKNTHLFKKSDFWKKSISLEKNMSRALICLFSLFCLVIVIN